MAPKRGSGAVVLASAAATAAVSSKEGLGEGFVAIQPRQLVPTARVSTSNRAHGSFETVADVRAQPATLTAAAATLVAVGVISGRKNRSSVRRTNRLVVRKALEDCPYTLYGNKDIDVAKEREELQMPECPLEIHMPQELAGNIDGQREYFAKNLPQIYKKLKTHGAIVFRGFEISRDKGQFQTVGQSLELEPCEDPLHSVAARDAVNKEAGVYEAVNKPSRSKFYIGMHNEMVGNRAPGAALFVCFKAAEKGGEFMIADGRKMFKMLDKEWLETCYQNDIVYSTAEFPMGFIDGLPGFLQGAVQPMAYGVMTQALKMKVDFETELRWERSDYDGSKILQVRAMPQTPVVRHHHTGEPCWWGSMHSHAEYLRSEREKVYGEAQETTGASRINKTDVFYGKSGDKVEVDRLKHLDEVTMKASEKILMKPGDMVLLDNYLVMHGRCPFEGTRLHAVSWFKSPDYSKAEE